MTTFSFDPTCQKQREEAARLIALYSDDDAPISHSVETAANTLAARQETAANEINGALASAAAQTPAGAPAVQGGPQDPNELDCHGMTWDPEIHSTPAVKNKGGDWRARKGGKDELAAAIAAHKAGQTQQQQQPAQQEQPVQQQQPGGVMPGTTPQGQISGITQPHGGMPVPGQAMPATSAPTTPKPPITYEQMSQRFVGLNDAGRLVDHELIYSGFGATNAELQVNQTMINRFWLYMDAIENGCDHATALQHGLANAG